MRGRLNPGRFYGRTLKRLSLPGLTLADVEYAPYTRVPRHSHEHGYFCLIRRGGYVEEYSRSTRVCGPRTVVFHPPGESHSESFGKEPVTSFNVEIGPEWLAHIHDLGGTFDQPVEFHAGQAARLAAQLFQEFLLGDSDAGIAIECTMVEILAQYLRVPPSDRRSAPLWLHRATERLEASFSHPVSFRQLAQQAGVHPIHFAAMFRRFNGCSVLQYQRRRKLQRARNLLNKPDMPLSQVALECGFADQAHLTRTYKRFTGRTPAQERTFLTCKTKSQID